MARFNAYPLQATAKADGTATAKFSSVLAVGQEWEIQQITVSTNSAATTRAAVYVNGLFFAGTNQGNGDTASGLPSLTVGASDNIQIIWAGCNTGDICTAVFFYDPVMKQAA